MQFTEAEYEGLMGNARRSASRLKAEIARMEKLIGREKEPAWSASDCEPLKMADTVCPDCGEEFRLRWEHDTGSREPVTLALSGCPSGGIYGVVIRCPKCGNEEEI